MLAWTVYISFMGVLALMLLPTRNAQAARVVALSAAVGGLALGLLGALTTGPSLATVCKAPWIPAAWDFYHLATDA